MKISDIFIITDTVVTSTNEMPDNVESSSQPYQCWSWVGGLIGVVAVGTGIVTVLVSIIIVQGYTIR